MFLKQSILPLEKPAVISSNGRRYFKIIFVKEKKKIQSAEETGKNWNKRKETSYQFEVLQIVFTQVQDQSKSKIKFEETKELKLFICSK